MKNEPWRGIPGARDIHLETKLQNKKAEIRRLEAENARLREEARRFYHADGSYESLPAEQVIERRVAAAAENARLREQLATIHAAACDVLKWERLVSMDERRLDRDDPTEMAIQCLIADRDLKSLGEKKAKERLARAVGLLRELEDHMDNLPTWRSACEDGTESDWYELPRDWVGRDDEIWEKVDDLLDECDLEPQDAARGEETKGDKS